MIPKYKVWDKAENRMWNVETLFIEDEWVRANDGSIYGEHKDIVRSFELLQSTGLKDKNGVEIFEGNIVRIKSSDGVDYKAVIIFKDGGFCAVDGIEDNYSTRRYQLHKGDFELEVIGNKYEHPHLLEG